jgi:dipeptidyl aminopeptidase/acylaminoacyl peptidase
MKLLCLLVICLFVLLHPAVAGAAEKKRPMTLDDMFKFKRVSDSQVSPDGKSVVYVVGNVDLAGNKMASNLWLAPTEGGEPRQLTTTDKKDRHPRWSPDGKSILFESNRSGEMQLWLIDISGGEARQLTTISTEAGTAIWSRDGKHIAFVSAVYPEFSEKPFKESDEANKKKIEEAKTNPVKAKAFKRLFYRHWDSYVEDKRQHLFVISYENGKAGEPRDVTPGDRDAYPTSTTFSVGDDFTFTPCGEFLVFTAVPAENEAWSTNHDLCRVGINNKSTAWETLTKDNPAADGAPQFSPDGKKLAYRAQKKAGYEADKWEIMAVETGPSGTFTGEPKSITTSLDRSGEGFAWAGNDTIYFAADDGGGTAIFEARIGNDKPTVIVPGHQHGSLSYAGGKLAYTVAALDHPAEVFVDPVDKRLHGDGTGSTIPIPIELSKANAGLLAELEMPRPESVMVDVEGGKMQMWILKPPAFDAGRKWPVAFLVHGGPQGAWEDGWSFRWCPELWAAQGYVVALPNPRGSTGFGQKFVDEITGDWGGKCFDDLMKGADFVEKLPFVDKDRIGAAGASFGGYMMNWFAVSTGRFKCLISHCGVWNFESMYATTDEVWFDEWEHGGPPWGTNRESYEKHSPHKKAANLGKFKTPMLLIQNDLDFRCPIGQGHELFTALQRQGVKSRFINFPDEGHWVLKPKNSEYWHKEVFAWLKEHVPPGGR